MIAARSRSVGGSDEIGGAWPAPAHAHVERRVVAEREAALGLVELHRRHADIEHHTVDGLEARAARHHVQIGETVLDQRQPAFRLLRPDRSRARSRSGRGRCRSPGNRRRRGSRAYSRRRRRCRRYRCRRRAARDNAEPRCASTGMCRASPPSTAFPPSRPVIIPVPLAGFAARSAPSRFFSERIFPVASERRALKRSGAQIWNLWPSPTNATASMMPA